jgi:rhodanese-related sulfurtransferase
MSECTVIGLKEQLENGEIHLVDVREEVEFAGGRVSGANLLPLGELEERHQELDHSKPIYVMCRTGRRSAEAQQKLRAMGFTNVVNVSGGLEAWKQEDLPVERDEHAPWSIDRQVRFTAGLIVLAGVLLSLFVHPYFIVLSGFVGFGLTFTAAIDWCGMGLLIAKMPWNRRTA